ncbi:DUF1360 domain-containing protein [Bacillus massilinigeriensis]|uniref:DUF1360 domain-containing protein n=1 Tax=Bacillus massilionigeriensis TaxID=1805475 RepID=UPI00096B2A0E|nr:DUF1360 domain-containing protein [Bacillus massilionigeriensis]
MGITLLDFLLISLASFRLTRLIVFDKITEFIRAPFFDEVIETNENGLEESYLVPKKTLIRGFIGELLGCYWCTGIWSSLFLCIVYFVWPSISIPLILILAVAGLAALVESILQYWMK